MARSEESRRFEAETIRIMKATGALLSDDHFVYISGDHGSGWIDKDVIYPNPRITQQLCEHLAEICRDLEPDYVAGPATGGLVISQWTAFALGARTVFAEHETTHADDEIRGRFVFHRGYDRLIAGARVLVVDDIVNTGHSIRQTIDAARRTGADVVAAGALVDRGNVTAESLGAPEYRFLAEYDIPSWPAQECPLCAAKIPVNTRYAHGADYLDSLRERGN